MMKKTVSIILALTLLMGALGNAFAESEPSLAESAEPQITLAEAAAPTEAPTATPSPTAEPTAEPTPTSAPETAAVEESSAPTATPTDVPDVSPQGSESPEPTNPSDTPTANTPAPSLFEAGMAVLAKGATLFEDQTLQTVAGLLLDDGIVYA